ncbi:YraN family protein [Subtercola endophyticus]|uniref:YraN family protein n=1 Tax=Subtercola endophyticus TaxID=2895559 RepID=UPI001E31383B|nr:YraN family protein [Subtercola endophyticus]UFS60986.1 YraN family protein [Subtercola endophyticus]
MKAKDELGRRGEQLAVDHLVGAGYTIVQRNWRCTQGEIDIVAERRGVVVFVEVKTRSGLRYGHPFEAITVAKLARLKRLSAAWCEAHGAEATAEGNSGDSDGDGGVDAAAANRRRARRQIRIDAIGVVAPTGRPATIEHLEGIF